MVAAMKDSDLHDQLQHDLMIQRWMNLYGADDHNERLGNKNDGDEDDEDDEE
jgi:hypothetical protein